MFKNFLFLLCLTFFFNLNLLAQRTESVSKPISLNVKREFKTTTEYLSSKIQRWAVVIGVSEFKNSDKGIPPLRFADADAKIFYEFLQSPQGGGFPTSNMRLLINKEATKANMEEAVNVFLGKALEEDIVIIFFAGHGTPDPNNPKNLFLVTYDADPEKMASTGFLMDYLKFAMERYIKAKNVLVFADACHSAGITGQYGTRGEEDYKFINRYLLELADKTETKLIFTSTEANERSLESEKWGGGHGVFTWALLQGLKGAADGKVDGKKDGIVQIGELIDYTTDLVRRETNGQQHPIPSGTQFDRNLPISVLDPNLIKR
jgi:uncharacterized caspase-like protein